MLSAGIPNEVRRAVYRRDHYACALCDDNRHLQIHHAVHRSQGGSNSPHNLITLCHRCHALAHGTNLYKADGIDTLTPEDVNQAIVEYLADLYAPDWDPWETFPP